jgi:hypothetical protein
MSYDPLWMFRWPLSGDVTQRISAPWFSPALTINYAGDAEIESHVVSEVASYGKQIGWLNEIVLDLANKREPTAESINRLAEAVKEIESIKERHKQSTLQVAVEALDKLQDAQPKEYVELLRDRK